MCWIFIKQWQLLKWLRHFVLLQDPVVQENLQLGPILRQLNSLQIVTTYFSMIHFNNIISNNMSHKNPLQMSVRNQHLCSLCFFCACYIVY